MTDYSEDFEKFWAKYYDPSIKAGSKKVAFAAWLKTAKERPELELMLACVEVYNQWLKKRWAENKRQFPAKCHAATFLSPRQTRWETFLEDAKKLLATTSGVSSDGDLSGTDNGWTELQEGRWRAKDQVKVAIIRHDPNWSFSAIYENWLKPTRFLYEEDGYKFPEIICSSQYWADELEKKYGEILRSALGDNLVISAAKKEARKD
jgi:hypothetical protein